MAKGIDLELLRSILQDDTVHIALATVDRVQFAPDASAVYVNCTIKPEGRSVLAMLAWDSVGAGSCSGDLPEVNDLVLVCVADKDYEHTFIFKRMTSAEEKLPLQMKDGHFVTKAKPGKKLILGSDTKVEIGKANAASPPTEPLVLGAVLTTYLTALEGRLEAIIQAINTGPIAISTAPGTLAPTAPALIAALTTQKTLLAMDKSTYLTTASTNIVSQIAVTER